MENIHSVWNAGLLRNDRFPHAGTGHSTIKYDRILSFLIIYYIFNNLLMYINYVWMINSFFEGMWKLNQTILYATLYHQFYADGNDPHPFHDSPRPRLSAGGYR